jgi:GAF domain-containing protein
MMDRYSHVDVDDLCRPFLESLPISGVSVTVIAESGSRASLCSSDVISARIDELQFELGEGPQQDAARTGQIVAIPDVRSDPHEGWPVLGAALRQLDVGAIFAIPLRMGAVTVGIATLHRTLPGDLTEEQRVTASAIASAVSGIAIQRATASADDDTPSGTEGPTVLRREVHQATGIMLVQLDTTATIAYSRLQAYAFANGRTVLAVARDVVAGTLTFDNETRET